MKPTKQLIRALRETAMGLRENKLDYCWICSWKCNCGLLVQNLLDINSQKLKELKTENVKNYGLWGVAAHANYYGTCSKLFTQLEIMGLEKEDFYKIENIDNDIQNRSNPIFVANWMDKQADELERRRIYGNRKR